LRANHLIYGNDWIDAAEAERVGLVGQVVPHAELGAATAALLERVRGTGPVARAAMKREMARNLPAADAAGQWLAMGTPEQAEAYLAFNEKRAPVWPIDETRGRFVETSRRPAWRRPV
jgi:enoyl-CoA hydratase/carnithine racemase